MRVGSYHGLAHAEYRAGRLADAEQHIRRAIELQEQPQFLPLEAMILQQLGKAGEARRVLADAERRHGELVKQILAAERFAPVQWWEAELWYQSTLHEARQLILGSDPGLSGDELALVRQPASGSTSSTMPRTISPGW